MQLLNQLIAGKYPLINWLSNSGTALMKLVGVEEGGQVKNIIDGDTERYERMHNSICDWSNKLEEALLQTLEVRTLPCNPWNCFTVEQTYLL